jgi:hypothetical protein
VPVETLSQDKNSVGVKELPVAITSLHYYKQSGNNRYKVQGGLQGWAYFRNLWKGRAVTPTTYYYKINGN